MAITDSFDRGKRFHAIIPLHKRKEISWEQAHEMAPNLLRGWWEISKIDREIKLEFIHDFWFNALPYLPHIYHFLDRFFAGLEELGVYLIQKRENASFEAYFYYQLKDRCFWGSPPLLQKEIERFKEKIDFPFPEDFLSFFRIHDGFYKGEDTGIFSSRVILEEKERFDQKIFGMSRGVEVRGKRVDPALLYPFYRSFDLDHYQCFYEDWYPDREVGNVFCVLSDRVESSRENKDNTLAFPSFLDWLAFYLE